jgi:hypothetical protein
VQVALDERLRGLEREHTARQAREQAEWQTARQYVQTMQNRREEAAAQVARARALAADKREQVLETLKQALDMAEADLARAHNELKQREKESEKQENICAERLLQARKELVAFEERLRLVERRQEARRERIRAQVRDAEERLRQLEDGAPPARRDAELERKLDLLLREVACLRQELRRRPSP